MDNHRLSRIEDKLDKLAEAVVSLARMEERMVTLFNRMGKYEERQEGLERRIDEVEDSVISNGVTLRFAERVFWVVLSAAISTGFWYLR
jgi:chromosome segregation ATPase